MYVHCMYMHLREQNVMQPGQSQNARLQQLPGSVDLS